MGYEYLIMVRLTATEKQELTTLFKKKSTFSNTITADGEEVFEFKSPNSTSQMPDTFTAFQQEGIYVCQNLTSEAWSGLEDLKTYLQAHDKTISVEEL
jgi:hypothetical protein